ncbi:MAG: hypothetical protein HZA78_13195 [Candidatus Schekmanbacteria bacterium]|nr:hypothetical protein [Candidatus Schekmanbacteria bacterium]
MKNKPFTHTPSLEDLIYFSHLSARKKLEWLKDANEFVNNFVPAKKRRAWERFQQKQRLYSKENNDNG